MNLDEIRQPWEDKCVSLIDLWTNTELGLMTIERWQAMRREFYFEIQQEMEQCGNNYFLPPSLKRLVKIRGPHDLRLLERQEKGWQYCREMASMNEAKKVLAGLDLLIQIEKALDGPFGYTIWKAKGGGYEVEIPDVKEEP